MGNFGEVFKLAIRKFPKVVKFRLNMCAYDTEHSGNLPPIPNLVRAVLPNLMLTKLTRYIIIMVVQAGVCMLKMHLLQHNTRGVVSMANSGPDTNGSQFFIIYSKQPHLDMKYTIIGKLVSPHLS